MVAFMDTLLQPTNGADPLEIKGQALGGSVDEDTFEVQHLTDGRIFERSAHPARDRDQHAIIGRIYCYRDITDYHNTQQDLIASRDKERLALHEKDALRALLANQILGPLTDLMQSTAVLTVATLRSEQAAAVHEIRTHTETIAAVLHAALDQSNR